ncbi:AAA family ATPase [Microbacterium trichothecenolyticum]|uniref:MoxR-like ATPase n=1 Tax=Microbacterium trichothecenolyticum TaxID=69370 RepID=A0ABU0TXW7_MICTR|nr:AAA family ATPase [Microbacterium trichothecenolyticum]MDQ1124505.1 MoxR-like ATPase [Microbacterium trichothecenolyticum]
MSAPTASGRFRRDGFWEDQRAWLDGGFPGRREQIRAMQLGVLAGEHVFLLGPPGTGKTSLVRAFASMLCGRLFEQTLSRTRPDSAVLGPFDIPLLRDHGRFQRAIEGYLLDCEWAFLDEIGHIAPDLGHDLLAALSDRLRHDVDRGRSTHPIPLRTAFTAGNAIPGEDGSDDARALWDRLLVRVPVDYLDRADAALLLAGPVERASSPASRSLADLDHDRRAVEAVRIAPTIIEAVLELRDRLREGGHVFSDRRWSAALGLCRAEAWLDGRVEVERRDLATLRFVLWDSIEQRRSAIREVALAADPSLAAAMTIVERARLLAEVCCSHRGDDAQTRSAWVREARRKHRALADAARELPVAAAWGGFDADAVGALAEASRAIAQLEQPSGQNRPSTHGTASSRASGRRDAPQRAGIAS